MQVKPILFSAPMVGALLEDRKSQTRRVLKPQPKVLRNGAWYRPHPTQDPTNWQYAMGDKIMGYARNSYAPGDLLWVRETWGHPIVNDPDQPSHLFRADFPEPIQRWFHIVKRWRPSIHMPRWVSRLTLEVTEVRVERLRDMEGQHPSASDAIAEGVNSIHHGDGAYYYSAFRNEPHPENGCDPTDAFRELWNGLHGPDAWERNP